MEGFSLQMLVRKLELLAACSEKLHSCHIRVSPSLPSISFIGSLKSPCIPGVPTGPPILKNHDPSTCCIPTVPYTCPMKDLHLSRNILLVLCREYGNLIPL